MENCRVEGAETGLTASFSFIVMKIHILIIAGLV
jgi:hypothetical protein